MVGCGTVRDTERVDLLIIGGRVMDPDSGLDAVMNVAVHDGVIVALTEDTLEADQTLDARGLVVAPGFIDLHAHGQDLESTRYQARDAWAQEALERTNRLDFVTSFGNLTCGVSP